MKFKVGDIVRCTNSFEEGPYEGDLLTVTITDNSENCQNIGFLIPTLPGYPHLSKQYNQLIREGYEANWPSSCFELDKEANFHKKLNNVVNDLQG